MTGPYHGNRLIDVSNRAAELLEFKGNGVARVRSNMLPGRRLKVPTTVN